MEPSVEQPPSENAGKEKALSHEEKRDGANEEPDGPSADFAALIHAIKTEGRAYRSEEKREDRGKKFREWVTIALIACTLAAVCWQVYEMIKVYGPIKSQADAAITQAAASKSAADAAEQTLIAAQRAWVGPTDARLDGDIKVGQDAKFVVTYQNTGREPALNLDVHSDPFIVTIVNDLAGHSKARALQDTQDCLFRASEPGTMVGFPTAGTQVYQLTVAFDGKLMDDDVLNGDKYLFIHICFTYSTFRQTHHSAACYFYKAKTTTPQHLNVCPYGSYAD